ncbi:MAG: prepilin-type N-terminal cleavage/methylation domain-containing protein [Deltaproteobacteria bacterium]|nr:prepilin-type N-terminal cleavage/methylation domain-containing protein [Deltaproteobacteria bacterium]
MRNSTKKRETGFTLIELLIAMALMLVVLGSLAGIFVIQLRTYNAQKQISEMTQNARAAMDIMIREIRMTGYGAPKSNLSTWIDWVTGVTMASNPKIEDGGSGPDIIHVAACYDGSAGSLSVAVSAGNTSITLGPGEGVEFNTTTKKLIRICDRENAVVTAISSDTLTIDTDPMTSGNQGLGNDYSSGDSVCIVKVISYSVVQETENSKTVYTLKRNENLGAGRQPLADNIVNLQITQSGDTIAIDPLTAQADKPDPNYSQNNGYRTIDQRADITPPNLLIN